ncbi:MAG TPA: 8-amino-7-oxononanoate synthase [Acidimicrobiales bacterium]|nr:8-amino-7-oxononanoate synthase [Acidimicrobiales bacterium]
MSATPTPPERPGTWSSRVAARNESLAAEGRWRVPLTFDARGPEGILTADDTKVVAFASNDYLGLSLHPAVVAAAHEALDLWGTGAGASRLVTGSRPCHDDLERALAQWKGTERAAVFPTGFAANLGVLGAFGDSAVRICSDELNHASIIDGARLAPAETAVYRHGDVDHLDALLRHAPGPTLVVTDVVFSMDGDTAPVAEIAELCRRHRSLLVLDEAHAVLAPDLAPELVDVDVLRVGTLSKTLGALGGFVAGARPFIELLENKARSYIFTTALTPPDTAAALAALRILSGPEGTALRHRLARHVGRVAPGHPSPIIPIVLGSDDRAMAASATLLDHGVWVPAIRPPTVPPGTARLRVTLSAAHTDDHVSLLLDALAHVGPSVAPAGDRTSPRR